MTVKSARIFGCPTCGFRVNEGDSSCPRCGHQFSSETKFECPLCGDLVEQGSSECPSCHVNYGEFREKSQARGGDESIDALLLEIIQLEAQSARKETRKFSCPGCSWMLDSGSERCPRCGRDLATGEEALQCPICGSAVSADSSACPECGCSFQIEERVRAAAEGRPEDFGAAAITETASHGEHESGREQLSPADSESEQRVTTQRAAEGPARPAAPEEPVAERGTEETEEVEPRPETSDVGHDAEERPSAQPEPSRGQPRGIMPVRVIAKPVPKPRHGPPPEPEPERAEAEETRATDEERPSGPPKKGKLRKLKAKAPRQE